VGLPAHVEDRSGEPVGVLARHCDQRADQLLAQGVVEDADHAEVDEPDPAVGFDEQVPRVGVGVEGAVLEDHRAQERG